jgi:hypothetical protein
MFIASFGLGLSADSRIIERIPALPYVVSIAVAVSLWIILGVACTWNPLKLFEGADGRPSTSKFQFWLWTAVIVPTFCGLYAMQMKALGYSSVENDWPRNLLIVMGLSVVTTTAAKAITVGYISSNRLVKTSVPSNSGGAISQIFLDDRGFPDLSKVQMLAWTMIAVVVYMIAVLHKYHAGDWKLPDIDNSLMVLMGLGQGAYLGKKLTSQDVTHLATLSPSSCVLTSLPVDVTIVGMSFGDTQGQSLLSMDGMVAAVSVKSWSSTKIVFTFPATQSNGNAWAKGQTVLVGLLIEGQDSDNKLPFSVS